MGRFSDHSEDGGDESAIDMSPLIDCVFILLIFFIVTTTFVEERGVAVDKPQAAPPLERKENVTVVLSVGADGQVMHEGVVVGLGGVRTLVSSALRGDEVPIIVEADPKTQTGMLMRVVDEAKLAGAPVVSVATQRSGGGR